MLVLSRKVGQEIRLPDVDVTIRLVHAGPGKAQVAIDAPRELRVLRGELAHSGVAADDPASRSADDRKSPAAAIHRLCDFLESADAATLDNSAAVVDDLIARLTELRIAMTHRNGVGDHVQSIGQMTASLQASDPLPVGIREASCEYCIHPVTAANHLITANPR